VFPGSRRKNRVLLIVVTQSTANLFSVLIVLSPLVRRSLHECVLRVDTVSVAKACDGLTFPCAVHNMQAPASYWLVPIYPPDRSLFREGGHPSTQNEPIQSSPVFEIKKAMKRMRLGKAPGATRIRTEHLRKWMEGAETDENAREQWKKVVEIVQQAFKGQPLPSSFGTGILVLIPKGEPDQFRGIALLEVVYKLVSTIVNARLGDAIKFHKAVHGFRRGRGTTTAIAEVKLVMRANRQSNKPLFLIFLDLKKAYDTLDRERTWQIMQGYGVGPRICNIIAQTWAMDKMIPKQAGFYAEPFATS
jgi:Reverse transcriptase (RNA-dependent DNA polymerase)